MSEQVQLQLIALAQQVVPMVLTFVMGLLLPQPKKPGAK